MKSASNGLAYLAALLYSFIIGFSFIFVKLALVSADPIDTLAYRFTASFIAVTIPVLLGWLKLNFNKKDILNILPLALFYPAMFFGFQVFGLYYTASSEAGIVQATVPIFTIIFASYFLKEETTLWQKLFIALSVSGVIFIFIMKGASFDISNIKGTTLILLSSLSFAGYSVLARKLTQKFKPMELSYIMLLIGFIFFNLISLIKHGFTGSMASFLQPISSPIFIIAILYLGVLSSLGTSYLSNYALSKMPASKMSVFTNLSTLIAILAGVIFLEEQLFYYHIIGALLIIAGVIGTNYFDKDKERKPPSEN